MERIFPAKEHTEPLDRRSNFQMMARYGNRAG
jgi:hypothetical protein